MTENIHTFNPPERPKHLEGTKAYQQLFIETLSYTKDTAYYGSKSPVSYRIIV